MTPENQKPPLLSSVVFEKHKGLLKGKNAVLESIFKFHWKKLSPFNLIWPQVDFLRIIRLMEDIERQKIFIKKNLSKAKELPFFKTIPVYLDALVVSCRVLTEIAPFKQDKLEKKEGRSVFSFSKLLTSYENAQDQLVRKGAFGQQHWMEIKSS